ncbi:hypothetical protein Ae707Ps1_4443c [Pseudonocardia sp. Ae707_Ps1]|nr:hypothetical protein Ae707Ps1_4443c [Pseudonocardia sp. Ae707_Ps1]
MSVHADGVRVAMIEHGHRAVRSGASVLLLPGHEAVAA